MLSTLLQLLRLKPVMVTAATVVQKCVGDLTYELILLLYRFENEPHSIA